MTTGGHAIMMKLKIDPLLQEFADQWIAASPKTRSPAKIPGHLTVVFVGRDLSDRVGEIMRATALARLQKMPRYVTTAGPLKMFGGKKDHLVALIGDEGRGLEDFRRIMMNDMENADHRFEDSFGFNPHVTLATGGYGDKPLIDVLPYQISLVVESLELKIGSDLVETVWSRT